MNKNYKVFIISMLIVFGTNMFVYFAVQYIDHQYLNFSLPIDSNIPLIPFSIFIYQLFYPFVIFCLFLLYKKDYKVFSKTLLSIAISLLIAYFFFIFVPTTVIRPDVSNYSGFTYDIIKLTYRLDNPVNCFPSCHCLLVFIAMIGCIHAKKLSNILKILLSVLGSAIIVSTLFTKQHVIIDVIVALSISLIIYYVLMNLKCFKKIRNCLFKV